MDEGEGYESGRSREDKACDSGGYTLDGSGKCEACDSEKYHSDERAEYDLEDDLSKDVQVHSVSPAGLPIELWLEIFEIVDDGRALLAAGCTCKALCDIVREIVERRRWIGVFDLASDPTRGYFMQWAQVDVAQFPAWVSSYDMKSLSFRRMWILGSDSGRSLALRPPIRCALSLLASVTELDLSSTRFWSFSDFARLVCALPNLATLELRAVTVNDKGGSTLQDAYFARGLRLRKLGIYACAFDESHPVWNLLTAPSLSDALKHISIRSIHSDPQQALVELSVPPAVLYSAHLAQLTTLHLHDWNLSCGDICSTVCRKALSRSSAGRISDVEIDCYCEHSPPHLSGWRSLFSVLDDTVTAGEFNSLRNISLCFRADHPFDADYVRTLVGSQSRSSKLTAALTMSNMVFEPESVDNTHSVREEGSEKTEVATEECTEGIAMSLRIVLGRPYGGFHRVTVSYTRHQSP